MQAYLFNPTTVHALLSVTTVWHSRVVALYEHASPYLVTAAQVTALYLLVPLDNWVHVIYIFTVIALQEPLAYTHAAVKVS